MAIGVNKKVIAAEFALARREINVLVGDVAHPPGHDLDSIPLRLLGGPGPGARGVALDTVDSAARAGDQQCRSVQFDRADYAPGAEAGTGAAARVGAEPQRIGRIALLVRGLARQ